MYIMFGVWRYLGYMLVVMLTSARMQSIVVQAQSLPYSAFALVRAVGEAHR